MMKKTIRKVLLINPKFQWMFMGWMAGLAFIVVLGMQAAHLWFFIQLRAQIRNAGFPDGHVIFQFVQDRQLELGWITLVLVFIIVAVVGTVGLILSHRIAGPMHRLRLHFEEVAQTRESKPIHFRKNDYFQEVTEAYNRQFNQGSS